MIEPIKEGDKNRLSYILRVCPLCRNPKKLLSFQKITSEHGKRTKITKRISMDLHGIILPALFEQTTKS